MSLADLEPYESSGPTEELGRTPPQDVAAEMSVLGGMMLSKDAIADVVEQIRGTDFYRPAHELIYDAIMDLYGRGEPADAITVAATLTRKGEIGRVGGNGYLHTLISSVPTAANAGYYARIVRERAVLRRLVEAGTRIVQLGYAAEGGDVDALVNTAQAEVYAVTDQRQTEDYVPLGSTIEATIDEIEASSHRGDGMIGVPTGFADLDALTNGLHGGQMIVIAARPAIGKALALDTPLPTPTGWTTMGEVSVGDLVLAADGTPTRVVAATEVMVDHPCYEVVFDDGTTVVADAQHQWVTREVPQAPLTTEELASRWTAGSSVSVDAARPLALPEVPVTQAYGVAALWAARGCPLPLQVQALAESDGTLLDDDADALSAAVRALLRGSVAQRQAAFSGIADVWGAPGASGELLLPSGRVFSDSAAELAASLGARVTRDPEHHHLVVDGGSADFRRSDLFLDRKRARGSAEPSDHRLAVEVRPVASVPVRCIEIEHASHLYLATRSMVPTHNSTIGLDILRSAAIKNNMPAVVFSLEMGKTEITMRLLSAEAKVPLQNMRKGTMREEDWTRLARTMGAVSEAPLFIDDSPNMTLMEIRAKCRRLKQQHGLKLVVIDYLQLMTSGKKVESRQQEVSEFSRALKLLAKELEVPVIAISQLNRGPEQRTDKRPAMADLRESGAIEQDADMIILLHREDAYEKESPRAGEADLIVAKHRNGPTDTIVVAFQGHYSRFVDMATG
ncbi:replicative DNA helicase [Quadrisphaera setariae]|uniref:Replicative DNA helicase n=1 Tax=Quadrisphaera setariae TaxID=2593304 RepID=A0A5C8ZFP1_9ACTN|nr:replicative DNA helicase [Quadrisphaera setariae]TXR55988.1 replicative DNA helicase [Quadrisphaera setariae]